MSWIKLHRSLVEWEWYTDPNTLRLLIHLLVKVNYEDKLWKGRLIEAGSLVTSWDKLASELELTPKQVRGAMAKLEQSGEVARQWTNKYQLVSLVKWDKLQNNLPIEGRQKGSQRVPQREGQRVPPGATTKEIKKERKKERVNAVPSFDQFSEYAKAKSKDLGYTVNDQLLKTKYEAWKEAGWKAGKDNRAIKNWKTTLLNTLPYISTPQANGKHTTYKDL